MDTKTASLHTVTLSARSISDNLSSKLREASSFIDRSRDQSHAVDDGELLSTNEGPMFFPKADPVVTEFVRHHGYWESEEIEFIRSVVQQGNCFVDIGAHVGYLTAVCAHVVGKDGFGIAVEPTKVNFALLARNLELLALTHVHAINAAAWNKTEMIAMHLSPDNSGDHRAYRSTDSQVVEAPGILLDEIYPSDRPLHFVKVDTQGVDHLALEGFEKTLHREKPVALVEFWPTGIFELGDSPENVFSYYRQSAKTVKVLGLETAQSSFDETIEYLNSTPGKYCSLVIQY